MADPFENEADVERLARVLALLGPGGDDSDRRSFCSVSASVTAMTGAGILLMGPTGTLASAGSADATSAVIDELQFTFGEGPSIDAHRDGGPVVEPDLAQPDVERWPAFAPRAVRAGVLAVCAFPLVVGAARVGAIHLYRDRTGPLDAEQHADALVLAAVAAREVLAAQSAASRSVDLIGPLDNDLALPRLPLVVHQASGMVAVQLGVPVDEALLRIRARAFGEDRAVSGLAADIVARRLRFHDTDDGPSDGTEAT